MNYKILIVEHTRLNVNTTGLLRFDTTLFLILKSATVPKTIGLSSARYNPSLEKAEKEYTDDDEDGSKSSLKLA